MASNISLGDSARRMTYAELAQARRLARRNRELGGVGLPLVPKRWH